MVRSSQRNYFGFIDEETRSRSPPGSPPVAAREGNLSDGFGPSPECAYFGGEGQWRATDGGRERVVRLERLADLEEFADVMRRINAQTRAGQRAQRACCDEPALQDAIGSAVLPVASCTQLSGRTSASQAGRRRNR